MLPAKHQSRVRSRTVRQIALRVDREQQRFQALPTIYSSPEIRRQLNVGSTAEASVPTKEMNRSKNPRPPQNAGLGNPSNQTTVHCCYSENSSRTHPRDWPIRQLAQRRVRCRPPPAVCPPSLLVAGANNVVLPIEPCDDRGARTRCPNASRSNTRARRNRRFGIMIWRIEAGRYQAAEKFLPSIVRSCKAYAGKRCNCCNAR